MTAARKKPNQSAYLCPVCGDTTLEPVNNERGELAGVKCHCGHAAELRVFPLPGAQGYFIGSDGRAYSLLGPRGAPGKLHPLGAKNNRGFLRVQLSVDGLLYYPYLAAAVLTAFDRPRPDGHDVQYDDGNPLNCALTNISWQVVRAPQVSAAQFVRVWQSSDSIQQVADTLGLEKGSVYCRGASMKKHGVPLKQLTGQRGLKIDWDELATIAESLNGEETKRTKARKK